MASLAAGLTCLPGVALAVAPPPDGEAIRVERPVGPDPCLGRPISEREFERAPGGRWLIVRDPLGGWAAEGRRGVVPSGGAEATPGAIRAAADRFLQRHATLLGAGDATLRCVRAERFGRAWHVTWQQEKDGVSIDGAILDCVLTAAGHVVSFRSRLVPPPTASLPAAKSDAVLHACARLLQRSLRVESLRSTWVPIPTATAWECIPAAKAILRDAAGGSWEAIVEIGSDRVVALESRLRAWSVVGRASAMVQPLYAFDAPAERRLAHLEVMLDSPARTVFTAADGSFAFDDLSAGPVVVSAGLRGRYVAVRNDAGDPPAARRIDTAAPGEVAMHFGPGSSRADERTIYFHANRIHDWVKQRFGFESLDFPLPATAAVRHPMTGGPDYANAYYDGEGIHFGNGGTLTYELGLFADVIYHEYTHGITDRMYRPGGGLSGSEGGAIHEGLSDYFACTLTNDPLVGENIFRENLQPFLRNLENTRQWPLDRAYQAHSDGEILAGALWDVRRLVGPDIADPLAHFARATFPRTFEQYARAVLLQDDLQFGDGAAANGSPHRDAIVAAFAAHGLGPGASVPRALLHEPLLDTEDAGVARRVRVGFSNGLSAPTDSLRLMYSSGGEFESQPMQRRSDGTFEAEIPAAHLSDGAVVRYYLRAAGSRSRPPLYDPPGAPDSTFVFRVGEDREPPRIAIALRSEAAAFAWPLRLLAQVTDNLGLASKAIEVRHRDQTFWIGLAPVAGMRGSYVAEFPNLGSTGEVFEYRVVAVDASRAEHTTRVPAHGWQRLTLVEDLEDDFEAGSWWSHRSLVLDYFDPWRLTAGADHTPEGEYAWRVGSDVEEYPAGLSAELVTDAFALGEGARASLWSWIDVEPNGSHQAFDGAIVQAAVDGTAAWTTIAPTTGYTHVVVTGGGSNLLRPGDRCLSGRGRTWVPLVFDLGAYARQRIRLRFVFESDAVASPFGLRGWMVDDLHVEPGVNSPTGLSLPENTFSSRLLIAPPAPNPGAAAIQFRLWTPPATGSVRLEFFDARGRLVRALVHERLEAGSQVLTWDGRSAGGLAVPAGVYYYRLASRWGSERGSIAVVR